MIPVHYVNRLSDPVVYAQVMSDLETLLDISDPVLVLKEIQWVRCMHRWVRCMHRWVKEINNVQNEK